MFKKHKRKSTDKPVFKFHSNFFNFVQNLLSIMKNSLWSDHIEKIDNLNDIQNEVWVKTQKFKLYVEKSWRFLFFFSLTNIW